MEKKYNALRLQNQLCFPLYAAAKEIVRHYQPFLKAVDLTYTQYITMMVMWEKKQLTAKNLGELLYLDSGTLTPVLKKLESKGYLARTRDRQDERSLILTLTKKGEALQEKVLPIPTQMKKCLPFTDEEIKTLYNLLYKMLGSMRES
jgi:DNA-binding MarR family transcriptional regulator